MEYELDPQTVADTLWARFQKGDSRVFSLKDLKPGLALGTSPLREESLFALSVGDDADDTVLQTAWGENHLVVLGDRLDPLWESAEGICAHMDADHADTYPEFLRMKGLPVTASSLSMPWVEERGFFLQHQAQSGAQFHWIAFPVPCPTANHVRKTLIQMLRGNRDE